MQDLEAISPSGVPSSSASHVPSRPYPSSVRSLDSRPDPPMSLSSSLISSAIIPRLRPGQSLALLLSAQMCVARAALGRGTEGLQRVGADPGQTCDVFVAWMPPPPPVHRVGKKCNLLKDRLLWAISGTQTVGSQTPPPPQTRTPPSSAGPPSPQVINSVTQEAAVAQSTEDITADTLVPLLAYVVAQSAAPCLHANVHYATALCPEAIEHTELSYARTTFEVALECVMVEGRGLDEGVEGPARPTGTADGSSNGHAPQPPLPFRGPIPQDTDPPGGRAAERGAHTAEPPPAAAPHAQSTSAAKAPQSPSRPLPGEARPPKAIQLRPDQRGHGLGCFLSGLMAKNRQSGPLR